MKRQYASANAFRVALEERLKNISKKEGTDVQRLRRQVAFDRYLCRLFKVAQDSQLKRIWMVAFLFVFQSML